MQVDEPGRWPSPFTPGFNQSPAVLVGRDDVLDAGDEALAMAAEDGRTPPPLLIVGSRGVGKTVLLAGWLNTDNNQVYLDPSEHIPDRPAAMSAGQARNQISIWDNANGDEIPTGGTGESAR